MKLSALHTPPRSSRPAHWSRYLSALLALNLGLLCSHTAWAQSPFATPPDPDFKGIVMPRAKNTKGILAGSEITIKGLRFKPGQIVLLSHGGVVLNADGKPYVADAKGEFEAELQIPADAVPGQHPVVVSTANPAIEAIATFKISPSVPLSGEVLFQQSSAKLARGVYQSAISKKTGAIFVTSSVGRPPVKQSELLRLNAQTLAIEARTTPAAAPGAPGGLLAVYGIGVDDSQGNLWVTNTRQNTVAVYRQTDLSLVRQFEPGTVEHPRDIVVDESLGRVYSSASRTPNIAVFDAKNVSFTNNIEVRSTIRGKRFSAGSLYLDPIAHKLYTVSESTNEGAVIDTQTGKVEKVFPIAGALGAIGVAHDAQTNRLFVASQGSDNLAIVDVASEKTLHVVPTGAGALNVTFDPVQRLAYVSNRVAGTVTVVDPDGNIVANLDNGSLPNHVASDGQGHVYALNKSLDADDAKGDRITRFTRLK